MLVAPPKREAAEANRTEERASQATGTAEARGNELTLVEDQFDLDERARLDAALEEGMAAARRGDVFDGEAVVRELLSQR